MVPLAEHFRIRLQDTRAIAPTRADRLTVIRSILDMARDMRLIGVGLVDTHAHGMVQCTHAEAMSLAHRITLSLHRRLSLPVHFEPSWVRPVENGSHGYNLFRYILTQNDHHGLDWDPLHEATNLPDLLGLRLIGGATLPVVREVLPRIRQSELLSWLGVSRLVAACGPIELLGEATLAAAALPHLRGRSAPVVEARRAALQAVAMGSLRQEAGRRQGSSAEVLCASLGTSARSLRRLRGETANPELVRAVQLQMGLIRALREGGPAT